MERLTQNEENKVIEGVDSADEEIREVVEEIEGLAHKVLEAVNRLRPSDPSSKMLERAYARIDEDAVALKRTVNIILSSAAGYGAGGLALSAVVAPSYDLEGIGYLGLYSAAVIGALKLATSVYTTLDTWRQKREAR